MEFDIRNQNEELFCKCEITPNGKTMLITKEGYRFKEISQEDLNRQVEEAKKKVS